MNEFRTAFDHIGIRYTSKTAYKKAVAAGLAFIRPLKDGKTEEKFYASYHDKIKGLTFYFRNHPLVDAALDTLTIASFSVNGKSQSTRVSLPNQPISVNGESQSTEMGNSIYVNGDSPFHIYQENTQKITQEITNSPCSPPGDINASESLVEAEVLKAEEVVDTSSLEDTKKLPLLDKNSNPGEDKNSARRVATKDKAACDYQVLVDLYNEYKPSLWRKCQLTSDREKALKRQFNQLGDKLAQAMIDALKWAESDEFWSGRKGQRSGTGKKFDLDSLFYQNRVQKWAGHLEEDAAEEEFKATHRGYSSTHVDRVHRTLANIADL